MLLSMVQQLPELYEGAWRELNRKPQPASKLDLYQLLDVSKQAGWITNDVGWKLGDLSRGYRNWIHPNVYMSKKGKS